jgi:hypothetical protein
VIVFPRFAAAYISRFGAGIRCRLQFHELRSEIRSRLQCLTVRRTIRSWPQLAARPQKSSRVLPNKLAESLGAAGCSRAELEMSDLSSRVLRNRIATSSRSFRLLEIGIDYRFRCSRLQRIEASAPTFLQGAAKNQSPTSLSEQP